MREAVGGQDNVLEFEGESESPDRVSVAHDLAEYAWGIIANAGSGDWTTQSGEWQEAAAKWRDQYHAYLRTFTRQESDIDLAEEAEITEMESLVQEIT